jgi:hypothetical protein
MSVLITAASHAEAYKLERLLQLPDVTFADHQQMPPLSYSGKNFIRIPKGSSPSYAHEILNLALNAGITRIFPLYANEILPLAESRELFEEYGIIVMVPSVLWLKSPKHEHSVSGANLLVIEKGKVLAGKYPREISFPEENFSGVFYVDSDENHVNFKLFAV